MNWEVAEKMLSELFFRFASLNFLGFLFDREVFSFLIDIGIQYYGGERSSELFNKIQSCYTSIITKDHIERTRSLE